MLGQGSLNVMRAGGASMRVQQRGFAENLKAIQMRITSTGNIQKITKSMKMVSAAKLRGDQTRLELGKAFGASFQPILNATPGDEDVALPEAKNPMYVVLSSDRGLCGGVNSFVAKETTRNVQADIDAGKDPKIIVLGDKANAPLVRNFPDRVVGQVHERSKSPANMTKALVMADRVIGAAPDADVYRVVYNRFVSAIKYDTLVQDVPNYAALAAVEDVDNNDLPFPLNSYEGEMESTEEGLTNMVEFGLATQLYGCIIDSATSEQSARMQAMDNASKNAQEMVEKLTIRYNRARQAKITTELIEIISGAESLKG